MRRVPQRPRIVQNLKDSIHSHRKEKKVPDIVQKLRLWVVVRVFLRLGRLGTHATQLARMIQKSPLVRACTTSVRIPAGSMFWIYPYDTLYMSTSYPLLAFSSWTRKNGCFKYNINNPAVGEFQSLILSGGPTPAPEKQVFPCLLKLVLE